MKKMPFDELAPELIENIRNMTRTWSLLLKIGDQYHEYFLTTNPNPLHDVNQKLRKALSGDKELNFTNREDFHLFCKKERGCQITNVHIIVETPISSSEEDIYKIWNDHLIDFSNLGVESIFCKLVVPPDGLLRYMKGMGLKMLNDMRKKPKFFLIETIERPKSNGSKYMTRIFMIGGDLQVPARSRRAGRRYEGVKGGYHSITPWSIDDVEVKRPYLPLSDWAVLGGMLGGADLKDFFPLRGLHFAQLWSKPLSKLFKKYGGKIEITRNEESRERYEWKTMLEEKWNRFHSSPGGTECPYCNKPRKTV